MGKKVLAFDLGASSGRGILASLDNGILVYNEVHRFENTPIFVDDTLCWNFDYLFEQIKIGINKAGEFDSIGIDTWGVDFGMLDHNGNLINLPVHYRDKRTDTIMDEVFEIITKEEIYRRTGIQFLNFNTIYQLYYLCKNKKLENADKILLIPDLLNYLLTGIMKSEYTISSTTQLLSEGKWDESLTNSLNIPKHIFCDIVNPGEIIGNIKSEFSNYPAKVIAVASHDTASAVVSVPAESDDFVYISCGTWSLFGTELEAPIINERALSVSYTNEGGYEKKTRFLTNIMGLWLIQESRREWKRQGFDYSYSQLEQLALKCEKFKCFINPDDGSFQGPGNIPIRIKEYCKNTNQYVPQTVGEIVRCIYDSLAMKYKHSLINLQGITNKKYQSIHIVGGGAKDPFLCQLTANACNVNVIAGPVEATALGNIVVQLISLGEIENLKQAREIIKESSALIKYSPKNVQKFEIAYEKFIDII